MPYKVFLVEDEIVAREGIRNAIDWPAIGFEFCGEASDGELALPRIEEAKPDVLITDIKMPFMDGLQLSKIIREHMPWIKVIILSGYDEFAYAQLALKIGVTEYLLKPVSATDIVEVLHRVATTLDQEKSERERLRALKSQVEYSVLVRREQLLLRLVMGGISSSDAIEQGQHLGLDLLAPYYLVMLIRIALCDDDKSYDYDTCQRVEAAVTDLVRNSADMLFTKKDMEALVLILKGDAADQLQQEAGFWAELLQKEGAGDTACRLHIGMGSPQERLSDLHRSFAQAVIKTKDTTVPPHITGPCEGEVPAELQKVDHQELENYLRFGDLSAFDSFFERHLRAICEVALQSALVLHYLLLEVCLTTAQFVSDLGGAEEHATPELHQIEAILPRLMTVEHIRAELEQVIGGALVFRDNQVNHQRTQIIQQAKAYIDDHFNDPDLQMNEVAKRFNLSPGHFSTVFSQEIGETFRDYTNTLRLNRAKKLLRTTNIKCAEVAYQSGYNDAHYFSTFFKKKTGFTPQEFRERSWGRKD